MKKSGIVIFALGITLLVAGCATEPSKQQSGAVVGAVLGGALGYGLGKGHANKELAAGVGALFGAAAGNYLGAQLDDRDRMMAAQNLQYSMELNPDGTTSKWQNPNTGNSGSTYPTHTTVKDNGTPCREFTSTIIVGGKEEQGYGTACRQADGSWKIVSG